MRATPVALVVMTALVAAPTAVARTFALEEDAGTPVLAGGALFYSAETRSGSVVKRLLDFPAEVQTAAARRAPHRLTVYAHETAQEFSAFYRDVRVVGAAEEGGDEDVRLALAEQARRVIAKSLDLLGVSAPEEM